MIDTAQPAETNEMKSQKSSEQLASHMSSNRNKSYTLSSIQNAFTDANKIAHCSLCTLVLHHQRTLLKGKASIAAYKTWSSNFLERLYVYLDISAGERQMVISLAEHGVLASDIASQIVKDVDKEAAKAADDPPVNAEAFVDVRYTILGHLFITCISDGVFDSRGRTLLKQVAILLEIPVLELLSIEKIIAAQLRLYDGELVQHQGEVVQERNKVEGKNRWVMGGLAFVAGGAVIGVTAGLAAPLIGAGIVSALGTFGVTGAGVAGFGTFMAGAGGLALVTTGGVLTGGGMSGVSIMRRTRGIEEFKFLGISDALQQIDEHKKTRREKVVPKEQPNPEDPKASSLALACETPIITEETLQEAKVGDQGSNDELAISVTRPQTPAEDKAQKQTHVLITITGFVEYDQDDHTYPYSTLTEGGNGDQYSLIWETATLKELGGTLRILLGEIASFIIQQGLQATVLPVLMAALTAPLWAIKLTYLVDNPWGNALSKAEKAGRLLADTLISQVQANRPVTLAGFSLGSRVIFFCLLELHSKGAFGIVEMVYMAGTPVAIVDKDWEKLTDVVAGRVVNIYSTNDTALGVLYRASSAWSSVAGLVPIKIPGVENVDASDLVAGHMDYYPKMASILKRCGFEVDSEEVVDRNKEEECLAELRKANAAILKAQKPKPSAASFNPKTEMQDEMDAMSQLNELMGSYWEPREIKSTLPALVLNSSEADSADTEKKH